VHAVIAAADSCAVMSCGAVSLMGATGVLGQPSSSMTRPSF
jgi:hypothetical protein